MRRRTTISGPAVSSQDVSCKLNAQVIPPENCAPLFRTYLVAKMTVIQSARKIVHVRSMPPTDDQDLVHRVIRSATAVEFLMFSMLTP